MIWDAPGDFALGKPLHRIHAIRVYIYTCTDMTCVAPSDSSIFGLRVNGALCA